MQTALVNVIEPIFDNEFHERSFGFRRGRGCHDALRVVEELLESDHVYVVDAELQGYVPQGAVLSPLLSNLYLNELDHRMAELGYEMVRYADDFVILCRSQEQAEAALEEVTRFVSEAGLTLHPEKTHLVDSRDKSFDFLGYSFRGKLRFPRAKSHRKMFDTIRHLTPRKSGQSMEATIAEINRVNLPILVTLNPLPGTTNRRAVCGRTARTVRREGSPAQPDFPTPIDQIGHLLVERSYIGRTILYWSNDPNASRLTKLEVPLPIV